jgi:hypothetical protein
MKIAFIFIVKDGQDYLQKNIDEIKKFDQDIYAIENNSIDDTKNILLHANLKRVICLDIDNKNSVELCETNENFNCSKRTRRLAYIRQQGLDAVMSSGITYDYICMLDMDFIEFDKERLMDMFMHMEKNKDVDALFGMSKTATTGLPYDIGAVEPITKLIPIVLKMSRYVEVDSAFSGVGIYRYSSIRDVGAKYDYKLINDIEHKHFNGYLNKKLVDVKFNPIYKTSSFELEMYMIIFIIVSCILLYCLLSKLV